MGFVEEEDPRSRDGRARVRDGEKTKIEAPAEAQRFCFWGKAAPGLESVAMVVAGIWTSAVLVGAYEYSLASREVFPGVKILGEQVASLSGVELEAAASEAGERGLDRELVLVSGNDRFPTTARELGAVPSPRSAVREASRLGRSGDVLSDLRARSRARAGSVDLSVGMRFDEAAALDKLRGLSSLIDDVSLATQLDLEHRRIIRARHGKSLLAYDSLSNIAVGLAAGLEEIELVTRKKAAVKDALATVVDALNIEVVLGTFSTAYSLAPKYQDRTHNLKIGAEAVDGTILMPGESFSFNGEVGERSAAAGYRYAPGISGGQIVDVLGGGICQIASSLYGAAFFSGMELVSSRPHSRPSGYIDMGLDSTVVWPNVDLKLRNDFDFPIVLHMSVKGGQVEAEILGPRRPYQVAFERELKDVEPYTTVFRDDSALLSGTQATVQRGMRGFTVMRVRKFYQAGEVVKEEDWRVAYPPTREIVRRGTNAAGRVPEEKTRIPLRDPAKKLRIMQ